MDYKKRIQDLIENIKDEKVLAYIFNEKLLYWHDNEMINNLYQEWAENATEEECDLEITVLLLEELFQDMIFQKRSITEKYMYKADLFMNYEIPLDINSQKYRLNVNDDDKYKGGLKNWERIISINKNNVKEKAVILHEMLHAHIEILNRENLILRDILIIELYKHLLPLYPDLDSWILKHCNIPHNIDFSKEAGEHDLLFFLKSLDLDYKCKFKPFTVFGYNYEDYIQFS